ncbi:transmembrane protein 213 isoform X1 [Eubalaena glacialis]|uniref:transmembrane protein 213 isoform X1 n=1 Tax=Eubalaena glacialis TaxID=27606 RepID=UPI002A5A81B4|nr:transmembrane protein 213 isoform X1 [Eubalaena glacialis]
MAGGPQLASAGTVITEASLLSMKHLSSAPWAALVLSLAFASFHPACLADKRVFSVYLAMLKRGPQTLDKYNCTEGLGLASSLYFGSDSKWDQSLAGFAYEGEASSSSNSTLTVHHPGLETLEQCPNVNFCPQAARCCHTGVDEYGWIAAAVGWSLLFLTLILLCVDKLMKLTPDEPKDLQA